MVRLFSAGKIAPRQVTRPELAGRIGQQTGAKPSVSQVNARESARREAERVAKINKEVTDFNKDINYETYQAKYNALSSDAKAIVKSPAQVFATPEYKQYQKAVAERKRIESENRVRGAYNETLQTYGPGMSSAKMVRRWGLSSEEQQKYMALVTAEARVQDKMTRQQTGQISYADGSFSSEGIKFSKEGDIIGTFGLTQASAKDLMDWQTEYKASQQPKTNLAPTITTGALTIAPTEKEVYAGFIKRSGYVKGTLGWAGDITERKLLDYQLKHSPYQARELSIAGGVAVETGPYFVPFVGPSLLIAGGSEDYIDYWKQGEQSRIAQRGEYFSEEYGVSPGVGFGVSATIPAVEIGVGAFGLKTDITKLSTKIKLRQLERTPTTTAGIRFETPQGGFDIIQGTKKVGRDVYSVKIEQPFIKTGDVFTLEGGRGFASLEKGKKINTALFTTTGRGQKINTAIKIGDTTSDGRKLLLTSDDFTGATGQIGTNIYARGRIKTGYAPKYGRYIDKAKFFTTSEKTSSPFVGFGYGDDVLVVGGGIPKTARLNLLTGESSILSPINTKGILKVIKLTGGTSPKGSSVFSASKSSGLISTSSTTTAGYTTPLVEQAIKTTIKTATPTIKTSPVVIPTRVLTRASGRSQYGYGGSMFASTLAPITQTSTQVKQLIIPQLNAKLNSDQFSVVKQIPSLKTSTIVEQIPITRTIVDTIQLPRTITKTTPQQKTITKTISDFAPRGSMSPSLFYPSKPIKPTRIIPPFSFSWGSQFQQKKPKKQQGYIPQAKSKGKWVNLSNKPLSREASLGRMARVVDNTTSAQGRIKKAKGKVSPTKDDYFGKTSMKFRPYRVQKGKKNSMHNQFIEKKTGGFRIDTRGELRGLTASKLAKQSGWITPQRKKRKKKVVRRKKK